MNSLRARLTLAFSLVAVLPLALALWVLGGRIQHTFQRQSELRLDAAIHVAEGSLASDGARLAGRMHVLASDARLKRFLLVGLTDPAALSQYLADQRYLLGLDHLIVTDTLGRLLGDAATALDPRSAGGREPLPAEALPVARDTGLVLVALQTPHALALEARVALFYMDEPVALLRGGMRLDSLFLLGLQRTSGLDLVLRDGLGHVSASTLPGRMAPAPRTAGDSSAAVVRLGGRRYVTRETALELGPGRDARLTALASTAAADDAVAVLRSTALVLGVLGVLLAIVLGLVWSAQVARPVVRLAGFSERIARGEWDEPLAMESVRELQTLVDALERMRRDLAGYRESLLASERQAAYGQMARRVAHEIKNPLTPIVIAVQGLKRAHDLNAADFPAVLDEAVRTVTDEVNRLKRLLQDFNDLGRVPPPQPVRFVAGDVLGELRTLHESDVAAGRLAFQSPPAVLPLFADRDQFRQVLLNLIQNGLDATAESQGRVIVSAASIDGRFTLTVRDDGPGLTDEQRAQLFVPGFTTKPHGSGLGLSIVERIVADHGGTVEVKTAVGKGTSFVIRMPAERED